MKQPKPIDQPVDPDLRGSWPALLRAARRARELAIQTGTFLVINRNGVIKHIRPEPSNATLRVQEPTAPYGGPA